MSIGDFRKGTSQASFNEDASGFVFCEIFIIAAVIGYYEGSWYWFGGIVIALIMTLTVPYLNVALAYTMSGLWGVIAYYAGISLFSQSAGVVIGGLAFLCGLGAHKATIEWAKDITDDKDRNA